MGGGEGGGGGGKDSARGEGGEKRKRGKSVGLGVTRERVWGRRVMCLDCGHLRQNVAPSGRPFVPALRDLRDSSVSVMADTVSSLSAVISTSFYWYLSISLIKAQIF